MECIEKNNFFNSEQLQKQHFNKIFSQYETHYFDKYSREYRLKFIYDRMFEGIPLWRKNVLEAMCGSGQATDYLISKGAMVTGLDISEEAIGRFKKSWPDCFTVCGSVFDLEFNDNFFDCVAIVGGLHHLHPYVDKAILRIHRILKKGGIFCFAEPHSGSLPDIIRKIWYKYDNLLAKNEASINIERLKKDFFLYFDFIKEDYFGNMAYLFVMNSMVLRIPLWLKSIYSPFLLYLEKIIENFQDKKFSCFVVCRWQKK